MDGFNLHKEQDPDYRVVVVFKITEEGLSKAGGSIDEAVKCCWPMADGRVNKLNQICHLVLAVHKGICRGVYEFGPNAWERSSEPKKSGSGYKWKIVDQTPGCSDKAAGIAHDRYLGKRFLQKNGDVDRNRPSMRYFPPKDKEFRKAIDASLSRCSPDP